MERNGKKDRNRQKVTETDGRGQKWRETERNRKKTTETDKNGQNWAGRGTGEFIKCHKSCVMCHMSHVMCPVCRVACHLSLTPKTTATGASTANSPTMQRRLVHRDPRARKKMFKCWRKKNLNN